MHVRRSRMARRDRPRSRASGMAAEQAEARAWSRASWLCASRHRGEALAVEPEDRRVHRRRTAAPPSRRWCPAPAAGRSGARRSPAGPRPWPSAAPGPRPAGAPAPRPAAPGRRSPVGPRPAPPPGGHRASCPSAAAGRRWPPGARPCPPPRARRSPRPPPPRRRRRPGRSLRPRRAPAAYHRSSATGWDRAPGHPVPGEHLAARRRRGQAPAAAPPRLRPRPLGFCGATERGRPPGRGRCPHVPGRRLGAPRIPPGLPRAYRLPPVPAAPAAAPRASRRHHPRPPAPGSTTPGARLDNPLGPVAQGRTWPVRACLGAGRRGPPAGQ